MDTVQLSDCPPVLDTVKVWADGVNGPPAVPADANPVDGVTESIPGGAGPFTVRLTPRAVSPFPLVMLEKFSVSEYDPGARPSA